MLNINRSFLNSTPGFLKIAELVFGFLCWVLLVEFTDRAGNGTLRFVISISVSAWISTMVLFLIYLFNIDRKFFEISWPATDFYSNAFWTIAYFVAACVMSANTNGFNQLKAALFFAFFTTAIYFLHCFSAYKRWNGIFPWERRTRTVFI